MQNFSETEASRGLKGSFSKGWKEKIMDGALSQENNGVQRDLGLCTVI